MAEPTHTASTEQPAKGGHGGFPPFQSETFASQLVWLTIAFVLLYVLMAKLALPRVASIIESRQKHIEDDLADASRLKGELDAAVAAYEKALADARDRAQAIATETRERQAAEAEARARPSRASSIRSWLRPKKLSQLPSRPPWAMCAASPRTRRARLSSA